MSTYRHEWASQLFDWMLIDPEIVALLMFAGCVLGFAVFLWELAFYVQHRARWMQVRTLAARRRLRQQRERDRLFFVGVLRRRLDRLGGNDAH